MTSKNYSVGPDDRPLGRDWKSFWRQAEQEDPLRKREIRIAKREARRRIHKANRRNIKNNLRHWKPDQNQG